MQLGRFHEGSAGSSISDTQKVQIPIVRWTPHPVIVTIGDNRDYIRVLLYSYYTTITGWGVITLGRKYVPYSYMDPLGYRC